MVRSSALSTIPEVSSQREAASHNLNNLNNNLASSTAQASSSSSNANNFVNKTTATSTVINQPPDLIVHSGNWQEHSFDSSIVTEGHYDASFESEVMAPVGPRTTSCMTATTTAPTASSASVLPPPVTSGNSTARPRPPPLAHSAKKSVFSVSGLPNGTAEAKKPSSLMLWKKVQHMVVVGGTFVSSGGNNTAESDAATAGDVTNQIKTQQASTQ